MASGAQWEALFRDREIQAGLSTLAALPDAPYEALVNGCFAVLTKDPSGVTEAATEGPPRARRRAACAPYAPLTSRACELRAPPHPLLWRSAGAFPPRASPL
jgi:hypothetical protein